MFNRYERRWKRLADGSVISHSAEHIRKQYRKSFIGSYIIFFKENNDAVEVVRILHHGMDKSRL
ncbi:type II toxin-antitoxin system RelE/ParE family toxin [Agrobacterium rosae]